MSTSLIVRFLGEQAYEPVWRCMQRFTSTRNAETPDEIWILSHPPVYTQGQAGLSEHLLNTAAIPVVKIDRGGQVTYHGPGQLVVYVLVDIRRMGLGVRDLVRKIEDSVIETLASFGVIGTTRERAPGVYVDEAKIAALGLRIRRGCSYHGLALNVDMDLSPFAGINPCGYQGMAVTQLRDQVKGQESGLMDNARDRLLAIMLEKLPTIASVDRTEALPELEFDPANAVE